MCIVMRNEFLGGELFLHIDEAKYVVERWRINYNHYRPHSGLEGAYSADVPVPGVMLIGMCPRRLSKEHVNEVPM